MRYKEYFVYLMTNAFNTVIYTGVTNDLERRVHEHKQGSGSRFTRKYKMAKLVYFESCSDVYNAIEREKQIKAGSRLKKMRLIESMNPRWVDLSIGEIASPLAAARGSQ